MSQSEFHKWTLRELSLHLSQELMSLGKERTARAYMTVLNGVTRYNNGKEVYMEDITTSFLINYEAYMREKGNSLNTISFYMRNLRAIYNKGIKRGLYPAPLVSVFSGVYTGVNKTPKRAIPGQQIVKLEKKAEEIRQERSEQISPFAVSLFYFLFCFYARGMSFVDMVHLKKSDLSAESLRYCRKKTGQWLEIKVTPEMKKILRFFSPMVKNSGYLFPVLKENKGNLRLQYESALRKQNKHLKRVGLFCGITEGLTTHVARHTWATMAKQERVPLQIISESLGHTSIKTTAIYLDSFEQKELDKANRKVARVIQKAIQKQSC